MSKKLYCPKCKEAVDIIEKRIEYTADGIPMMCGLCSQCGAHLMQSVKRQALREYLNEITDYGAQRESD